MKKAHGVFKRHSNQIPENDHLIRSILNMLLDFYSPNMERPHDDSKIISKIRKRLMKILLIYLKEYRSIDSTNILSEYLVINLDKSYCVKELLHTLTNYLSQEQSKQMISLYNKKNMDYSFIVKLFLLLRAEILHKSIIMNKHSKILTLNQCDLSTKENIRYDNNAESVIDLYRKTGNINKLNENIDSIIAYIMHILLTIQWADKVKDNNEKVPVVRNRKTSLDIDPSIMCLNNKNLLRNILWPKIDSYSVQYPQEVLLHVLFDMAENGMKMLGYKVYLALVCHALSIPETFLKHNELTDLKLIEDRVLDTRKFTVIYKAILLNLDSFTVEVQQQILKDTHQLSKSDEFLDPFLSLEGIPDKVFDLIQKAHRSNIPEIQEGLINVLNIFLEAHFESANSIKKTFHDMRKLPSDIVIVILNKLIHNILRKFVRTEMFIVNMTQLIYLVEDMTLIDNSNLAKQSFAILVGRLLLYLNKINMIYLWHPLLNETSDLGLKEQRKGGIARSIFKVILGMVMFCTGEHPLPLARPIMRLLRFFLYRKASTHNKLIEDLGLENELPSLKIDSTKMEEETGFVSIDLNIKEEQKYSEMIYLEGKSIGTNPFDAYYERTLYAFMHIFQIFIYTTCNVSKYSDINKVIDMKKSSMNTYKGNTLAKILAKLAFDFYERQGLLQDVVLKNLMKKLEGSKRKIMDFHSGIDFFCRQYLEDSSKKGTLLMGSELSDDIDLEEKKDSSSSKVKSIIDFFSNIKAIGETYDNWSKKKLHK